MKCQNLTYAPLWGIHLEYCYISFIRICNTTNFQKIKEKYLWYFVDTKKLQGIFSKNVGPEQDRVWGVWCE